MTETITAKPNTISFGNILKEGENQVAKLESLKNEKVSNVKRNAVFALGIVGGLFLIGMMAANIIAGMAALIVAGIGGTALLWGYRAVRTYDPLIRQKMLNDVYNRQIEEARENSIAQLGRAVISSGERLDAARKARDDIGGRLEKLRVQAESKADDTGHYLRTYKTVKSAYEQIRENVDKAAEAHVKFSKRVEMYSERYEFAKSAGEIMDLMGSSGIDATTEMLTAAAFEEIDTEFNTALVAIENLAHDNKLDQELKDE